MSLVSSVNSKMCFPSSFHAKVFLGLDFLTQVQMYE